MTVSLAHGGAGLGTVWGEQLARRMLADAGFVDVEVSTFPTTRWTRSTSRARRYGGERRSGPRGGDRPPDRARRGGGLRVLVVPVDEPPIGFGTAFRTDLGVTEVPGAMTMTWIETADTGEDAEIEQRGAAIVEEVAAEPGFIGFVGTTFAGRGHTFTAWTTPAAAEAAVARSRSHRAARTGSYAGHSDSGASPASGFPAGSTRSTCAAPNAACGTPSGQGWRPSDAAAAPNPASCRTSDAGHTCF